MAYNKRVLINNCIGKSKFDKLRRISVIKPIADMMELQEGDELEFFCKDGYIIIQKKPVDEDFRIAKTFINNFKEISGDDSDEFMALSEKARKTLTKEQYEIADAMIIEEYYRRWNKNRRWDEFEKS